MVSVIAHEFAEIVTNPDLSTGYYDAAGEENADKCAWQFSNMLSANSNAIVGGKPFLIQDNWNHAPPNSGCGNPQTVVSATTPGGRVKAPPAVNQPPRLTV